jgi:hypothetical protein
MRKAANVKPKVNSPYLQKLNHSNFLSTLNRPSSQTNGNNINSQRSGSRANSALGNNNGSRPGSANGNSRNRSAANANHNNNSAFNGKEFTTQSSLHLSLRRETSTATAASSLQRVQSAKPIKNKFLETPSLLKAVAYQNGTRNVSSYITAKSIGDVSESSRFVFYSNYILWWTFNVFFNNLTFF